MENMEIMGENTTVGMEDMEMAEESATEKGNEEITEESVTEEVESIEIGENGEIETEETENEEERYNGKRKWVDDESKETNKRKKRVMNEEVEGKNELTMVQKLIWELTTSEVKEKKVGIMKGALRKDT